jgi:hypothetical protein
MRDTATFIVINIVKEKNLKNTFSLESDRKNIGDRLFHRKKSKDTQEDGKN